jgi:hypothetical protein
MLFLDTEAGQAVSPAEENAWVAEIGAWYEKYGAAGKLAAAGERLQGARTARTVRASGVTDGPFMETKEVLGGFSVLEAASMDEAVEIAQTWPGVDRGWVTIEIRPVYDMS